MVNPKGMSVVECLYEGKFRIRSVVYADRARARCREELSLGCREGENVCLVGVFDSVEGEVQLGLRLELACVAAELELNLIITILDDLCDASCV
jgi:hypothetical protein